MGGPVAGKSNRSESHDLQSPIPIMPPWQEVAAHLNAKHRAGSNIPRSALPSAVRAVAEPASIRCIWWKRLAADARPSPTPAGLDQGDARPQDQDLPAAETAVLAVARGADRCAALRRQVLRRSVGVRAVVVHCDYARPHAAPNLLHALAKADGLSIDLSHGSSTFPKFLSIMRQLSPRKAIYKTS